ncbi:MAG: hypothetical protein P1P84_02815 [Deferrisomatales bacterium]|nr:hypothetical protein [Deferrisomatales bacterium]
MSWDHGYYGNPWTETLDREDTRNVKVQALVMDTDDVCGLEDIQDRLQGEYQACRGFSGTGQEKDPYGDTKDAVTYCIFEMGGKEHKVRYSISYQWFYLYPGARFLRMEYSERDRKKRMHP